MPKIIPSASAATALTGRTLMSTATITAPATKITRPEWARPPTIASRGSRLRSQFSFLKAAPHLTSGPGSGRMRRRPDRLGCSSAPPPRHDHLSVRTLGPRKHDLRQWDGIESSQMLVLFRHNVLEQPRAFP